MTWFGLLCVILITPVAICVGFWVVCAFVETRRMLRIIRPVRCDCGRRVLTHGRALFEGGTRVVHTEALCQPRREWVGP